MAEAFSEMLYLYSRRVEDERRWEPGGIHQRKPTEANGEAKSGNLSTSSVTMMSGEKNASIKM